MFAAADGCVGEGMFGEAHSAPEQRRIVDVLPQTFHQILQFMELYTVDSGRPERRPRGHVPTAETHRRDQFRDALQSLEA